MNLLNKFVLLQNLEISIETFGVEMEFVLYQYTLEEIVHTNTPYETRLKIRPIAQSILNIACLIQSKSVFKNVDGPMRNQCEQGLVCLLCRLCVLYIRTAACTGDRRQIILPTNCEWQGKRRSPCGWKRFLDICEMPLLNQEEMRGEIFR